MTGDRKGLNYVTSNPLKFYCIKLRDPGSKQQEE